MNKKNQTPPDENPSMEDILASIRKIIADDEDDHLVKKKRPESKNDEDDQQEESYQEEDVLELTDIVDDDEIVESDEDDLKENDDQESIEAYRVKKHDPSVPFTQSPLSSSSQTKENMYKSPSSTHNPSHQHTERSLKAGQDTFFTKNDKTPQSDTYLSEKTLHASSSAFNALTKAMAEKEKLSFTSDTTIEGLVRSILKPLMKDWLNAHLPPIVEKIVKEEIQKIVKNNK